MKIRVFLFLLTLALPVALLAAEEPPTPAPKPSLLNRLLHPFGGGKKGDNKERGTSFRRLEMALLIEPNPVKLSDNRQIKVTLTLTNRSGKMAQLEFPTSQRVEVLLKAKGGQTIEQWSQDQSFTNEPTLVTINPNERLEYSVNVATRDMTAGEAYTVEAFFPNFEELRKARTIAAEK